MEKKNIYENNVVDTKVKSKIAKREEKMVKQQSSSMEMCMHTGNKHVSSDPFMRFDVSLSAVDNIYIYSIKVETLCG